MISLEGSLTQEPSRTGLLPCVAPETLVYVPSPAKSILNTPEKPTGIKKVFTDEPESDELPQLSSELEQVQPGSTKDLKRMREQDAQEVEIKEEEPIASSTPSKPQKKKKSKKKIKQEDSE